MRYLHASDPNFEPVLLDLLEHEHEVYEELTIKTGALRRGERKRDSWEVVFTELTDILTRFSSSSSSTASGRISKRPANTFMNWPNRRN
jgi:hypothetical protein